jgi:tetratricopeptide (TPR) repeat protein
MTATVKPVQRRYTRSIDAGRFPRLPGLPELELNRMAVFWRPIIDMRDSEFAPMRLKLIQPVSRWLAEPESAPRCWFAMIGVAGLRHQVLRHAGLDEYEATDPTRLPERLRSPQWQTLVEALQRYDSLDHVTRSLVIFQLAQLSYCKFVVDSIGIVAPTGDPTHDRYAYDVARVHARYPGSVELALRVFAELAEHSNDPQLALASAAQGIGHGIRNGNQIVTARRFDALGRAVLSREMPSGWYDTLVRSRFHRAVALLRLAERDPGQMRAEVQLADALSEELFSAEPTGTERLLALENKRILLESQIKAVARARGPETADQVAALCNQLLAIDPYCVDARLVVGDGYATIGDFRQAAFWYTKAGELCTGAGALGWFRAGQSYDALGDRGSAVNAMGRCLELDTTATEARSYLEELNGSARQ